MQVDRAGTPTRVNRPAGWHKRTFWAKAAEKPRQKAAMPCRADYMDRESCPFHDLKAEGCFQPEYGGLGVGGKQLGAAEAVRRPDGQRLDCSAAKPQRFGMGGMLLPEDVEPNPLNPGAVQRNVSSRPWTSTSRKSHAFSNPEYVSLPPKPTPKPQVEPFFRTGKAGDVLKSKFQHQPDPYQQPSNNDARLAFRLRTGVPKSSIDPRLKFVSEEEAPPKRARSAGAKRPIQRQPFQAERPLQGTFSRFPSHESAPYVSASLKSNRRPLFTYAAKTKRSMPVGAPWTTGMASAEPKKDEEVLHAVTLAAAAPRQNRPTTASRSVSAFAASRGLPPRPATAKAG